MATTAGSAVRQVGDRPTVLDGASDLTDLGDEPPPTPALPALVDELDVDQEVNVVRDLPVGLLDGEDASLRDPGRQPIDGRLRGVRMGSAQGPRAGLHRLKHGGRLAAAYLADDQRSEEHTSELQSLTNLVCRLLL